APATPGTYHVVATSVADPAKTGSATVTVANPIAVSISPKPVSTVVGAQVTFTGTVTGGFSGQSTAVTWSVTEAGGGSVTSAGVYTAPGTTGTYHVVATSVADNTKSDTVTITVSTSTIAVAVSPSTANVLTGGTQTFTATVSNSQGGQSTAVTWSVQQASGGSV